MRTKIEQDGDGYFARVVGQDNLFAFAYSEKEAVDELVNVVEMMIDFHQEQINIERQARDELIGLQQKYAV